MVIVDSLHVVTEVPLARESIAGHGTLTTIIDAKERLLAMAVETVGLTLMTKEAGSGGKSSTLTGLSLAAVGLQVRVNEFAGTVSYHVGR